MNAAELSVVEQLLDSKKAWTPAMIPLSIVDALKRESQVINLMDFVGSLCKAELEENTNRYFIAGLDHVNTEDFRKKHLMPVLVNACAKAGFAVAMQGWDNKRNAVRVFCKRARVYQCQRKNQSTDENESSRRITKTARPQSTDEKCPFTFYVLWQDPPEDSQELETAQWGWYIGLSKNAIGLGNAQHFGHLKMKPDEVKKPLASIGQDNLRLVQSMAGVRMQSGAIAALVHHRTGTTLSAPQIQYASNLCKENPTLSTKHGGVSSPADRLIEYLSSEANISYVLLFAEPSSSLLSIPKQRKKTIKCILKGVDGREQDVDLDQESMSNSIDVSNAMEDTPEQYADRIRNALTGTIKSESKVLLAVAWVTDAQRRMLALFPEALCADVMFKSNAEQRPLFSIDGKTSENETFRALHAFMPSTCRFVYQWLFSVAVPKLHSRRHLRRNEVMGLDGEERQYSAFISTIPTVFPKSTHILCSWHLFD
jgi:MULE transposase domain